MTSVGVDFGALGGAAAQIGAASDAFGQRSGQVGALPGAAAPNLPGLNASALLESVLDALTDALRQAASELGDISAGLTATANSYQSTEQMLANWRVPGGTTL